MSASFLSLGRALAMTTFRAFLPAASALLAGTLLVAAVPFGPDGVHPVDVVRAMGRWPTARVGFWTLWVVLSWPVSARLVEPSWIRTLPVPTRDAVIWTLLAGLVGQAPWMILFALGESPLRGLADGLVALTLGLSLATGARLLFVAAAGVALVPLPVWGVFPVASILAVLGARRAWVAGPREPPPPLRILRRAPPVVAVSLLAIVDLVRGHRLRVARTVALAIAVAGALRLLGTNQPVAPPADLSRTLAVLALPSAAAAAWLCAPIASVTDRLAPLLLSMGRSTRVLRAGAALVALALLGAFGAACGARLGVSAAAHTGAWSAAIALLVLAASRGRDSTRGVVVAAALGTAGLALVLAAESIALPAMVLVAFLMTVRDMR